MDKFRLLDESEMIGTEGGYELSRAMGRFWRDFLAILGEGILDAMAEFLGTSHDSTYSSSL